MSAERVAELRQLVWLLEGSLALWAVRDETAEWETTPAAARRAGGDAVAEVERLLAAVQRLRSDLATEIRQFDDEAVRRADELVERLGREKGGVTPLPDETWHDAGSGAGWEVPSSGEEPPQDE